MTVSHPLAQPLRDRAETVAHRLLTGTGLASVVAYRLDPDASLDVFVHGVTSTGSLVVALPADALPDGHVLDVRMDVRREATEALVRITSASLHLLGQLTWLTADEVAALAGDRRLPDTARLLADSTGVRWARVTSDRVLMHDASGVTPFDYATAAAARTTFPSPSDELDAHDVVRTEADHALAAICRAVVDGTLPGRVQSERPSPGNVCDHTAGRVFCVDVDHLGINLMHVGGERTTVVFAPFTTKVTGLDDLATQVRSLATRAQGGPRPAQRGW